MATLQDYRNERLKKLEQLRSLGVDPFPAKSARTIGAGEVVSRFNEINGQTETVSGRIKSIRKFGKLAFIVIRDFSGEVQLFIRAGEIGELSVAGGELGITELNLLDTGDFIEATGPVIKTQTGEVSIGVQKLRILTKSLRPMPLGHEEFSDKEERLRRRYVDMNVNLEVRERFVRRAKFWQATRQFLLNEGFIEINIPVLEHTTGGADANPFATHMDALNQDFYLRISHELPLKRLIGAGYERVFDIGPRFRNEGVDEEHLPEHVAMESYAAFESYEWGMDFYERMIKYVCQETWGKLQFEHNGITVDLSGEWRRVKYADILRDKFDVDVFSPDIEQLKQILVNAHIEFDPNANAERLLDNVWKLIRKNEAGPFWLIQEPAAISPLAKRSPEDPRVTERFHPIIFGTEMGNGFSELNDPIDQLNRFQEQQEKRDAGDAEAMMLDIDFVEMLEYGMPPTCGWGNSERNFWLFEGVSAREGVPFPHMKHEISETTRKIYPDVRFE
ncbi:MAG: lysine--tRNA ligase [Candidatus Nomurabacteria bacterium]|jgi:lysyl-tRNA synthetase class 2|nr:lysine--tRNA ligase [Candidatus Nomurabacteria bacterium]